MHHEHCERVMNEAKKATRHTPTVIPQKPDLKDFDDVHCCTRLLHWGSDSDEPRHIVYAHIIWKS